MPDTTIKCAICQLRPSNNGIHFCTLRVSNGHRMFDLCGECTNLTLCHSIPSDKYRMVAVFNTAMEAK